MVTKISLQEEREKFLANGGILLRKSESNGEYTIEHFSKNTGYKWKHRVTFTTEPFRDKTFSYLTRKKKTFFKAE